ncbi:MAG: type II secretion system F family protein [Proteobacteria bacterium]|nr:type II secretion system F family protein [Pseudomonadota bacterium]MCP4921407.1 type II secretion system F family protein [Pseudomonadota bacterium]
MTLYVIVGVLSFLCVLGVGASIFVFANPQRTAQDRLQDLTGVGTQPESANPERLSAVSKVVATVAAPSEDSEDFNALRRRLSQAGFRQRNNVEMFSAARFTLAVLFPLICYPFTSDMTTLYGVGAALAACAFGYFAPALYVTNTLENRQEAIMKTFPDALDMLTASVEAGLGLDAAFRRVANEMEEAAPLLCAEMKSVNNEVSAGVPRVEALQHLEQRTGLPEIASLVNVLVQAERFGTPVARSLRVHSEMVRVKRMQRAEEMAAKISPKLTVAMILFMLPCLVTILLGPAVVRVVRTLLPAMAGQ